ncbi:MAG: RNA polymerase factor sigma-54 [Myxococcales bacterium]|nr:RNA polymerase factor sigma-54 [Myxococcales bacterium]
MGLEHRQTLRLEHKLVITPQLQQAIKLLQLNHMELAEILQEELLENPMLEQSQEDEDEEWDGEGPSLDDGDSSQSAEDEEMQAEAASLDEQLPELTSPEDQEEQAVPENFDEVDWEAYFQDMEYTAPSLPSNREDFDELPTLESRLTPEETMIEHLMQQLRLVRMDDDVREMSALIIGNLNEDGWLVMDEEGKREATEMLAEQMANQERAQMGEDVPGGESYEESVEYWKEIADEALEIVQGLEPSGVGARNLQESLLIQLQQRDGGEDLPLLERLVKDHLKNLERRNFAAIGKKMRVSLEALLEASEQIGQMDPRPGRNFSTDPPSYIGTPDIHVRKVGDQYYITLNDDGLPKLKISQFYKQAMRGQNQGKEFIQEKLRNATWLLRSIHQRQQTIYKVTESIVKRQRDFFDFGLEYLKPMILRDVAEDISMHESTVSRVTTNKYVQTPQGLFELKFFFTSSLQATDGGDDISSLTVKEKIKKMIAEEEPRNPLSDQQIVKLLESEGIQIARRTVAKYRNILNIPSSSRRKQLF